MKTSGRPHGRVATHEVTGATTAMAFATAGTLERRTDDEGEAGDLRPRRNGVVAVPWHRMESGSERQPHVMGSVLPLGRVMVTDLSSHPHHAGARRESNRLVFR